MLSTIVPIPLNPGTGPLAEILDRIVSVVSRVADGVRHLRYRRADLRRMSPAEMVSQSPSLGEAFLWRPAVRVGIGSHTALECFPNSRITYNLTLPPDASIVSWCTLAPADGAADADAVEFEIHVRSPGGESSHRQVVRRSASRLGRRWHPLRLHASEAGPAQIVLSTRLEGGTAPDHVRALWGNPHVETPRSAADLVASLRSALAEQGLRGIWHKALPANDERLYRLWVRETEPSRAALKAQRQRSAGSRRTFTLITFVSDATSWHPEPTASCLHRQSYEHWEWILLTADGSMQAVTEAARRAGCDGRARVVGLASTTRRGDAWNAGLREAKGDFAAVLGPDDLLSPAALFEVATALEDRTDCDLLYSDEDRVTRRNHRRHHPHFKPGWSPDLLLSSNYIGRLAMLRVATALAAGGFGVHGDAEEWDLFLRLARSNARIQRLPRCLYHRDEADIEPARSDAPLRAHCEAIGLPLRTATSADISRLIWEVQGQPTVSIVIPNRNAAAVFKQCIRGLLERTNYPHRELVIVDNGTTEPEVLDLYRSLQRDGRARIVSFDRPFNFSAACNAGAAAARGELLLFLNNDIEVIEPDWLDELVRWAQRPEIGIVGAKLLYPDRTIQHAGVVFGLGLVGHVFSRAPEGTTTLFGSAETYRNYLAVTGACQMMRKEVFAKLGGYDERFRLSFSDVVLCMEAWRAGYRVVYTPHARLIHHESYTRQRDDSAQDMELLARYLQHHEFVEDPYCHPELNPKSLVPALRPPFEAVPRQVVRDYVDRVLAAAAH